MRGENKQGRFSNSRTLTRAMTEMLDARVVKKRELFNKTALLERRRV